MYTAHIGPYVSQVENEPCERFQVKLVLVKVPVPSLTCTRKFWVNFKKSCTEGEFSHLQLSDFEGSLAPKLRFPSSFFQILRVSDVLARSAIVLCSSLSADRAVMAASRLLGAAAAWVILLCFAAGHRRWCWTGCSKVAIVIRRQILSILFFWLWRRGPVLELQFLTPLPVLLCFATQSLQITLQWLRQGCLVPQCRSYVRINTIV